MVWKWSIAAIFKLLLRERERSMNVKNISQLPPLPIPIQDRTSNLGMCPDWESKPQPFGFTGQCSNQLSPTRLGPLPIFLNWIDCFCGVELCEFFINFELPSIRYIIGKYLLPLSRLSFHFVDGFLCYAKTHLFDIVPICLFFLLFPLPEEMYQKNIAKIDVRDFTAYVFFYKFYGFKSYI